MPGGGITGGPCASGTTKLFSRVSALFYFLSAMIAFPISLPLVSASSCLTFYFNHLPRARILSPWIWFTFPQRLRILNIFSCAYWTFVCLLQRDVHSGSCLLSHRVVSVLRICRLEVPGHVRAFQIFLPNCVGCHFFWWHLLKHKSWQFSAIWWIIFSHHLWLGWSTYDTVV